MKNTQINLNDYPVGTGITKSVGSDRYPYEVIENISSKRIKIRELNAIPTADSDYYSNQQHTFESKPNGQETIIEMGTYKGYPCFKKVYHEVHWIPEVQDQIIEKYGSTLAWADTTEIGRKCLDLMYDERKALEGYTVYKKRSSRVHLHFGSACQYQDPCF